MSNQRILIRPTETGCNIIAKGTHIELLTKLEAMTEAKENKGEMLVNEEYIGSTSQSILREFATIDGGLVDTLIICDGIAKDVVITEED